MAGYLDSAFIAYYLLVRPAIVLLGWPTILGRNNLANVRGPCSWSLITSIMATLDSYRRPCQPDFAIISLPQDGAGSGNDSEPLN